MMRVLMFLFASVLMACKPVREVSEPMIAKPNPSVKNAPTDLVVSSTVFVKWGPRNCSGVVVGKRRVLTARHCIGQDKNVKVFAFFGTDLKVASDAVQATNQRPKSIIYGTNPRFHPNFDLATFDLENDIPKGFKVAPIHSLNTTLNPDHGGVAAGFGHTGLTAKGEPIGETRFIRWGYLSFEKWEKEARVGSFFYRIELPNLLIWGPGAGGSIACPGDSGGPLYAKLGDAQWGLLGLISNGDCKTDTKAIDLRAYKEWILSNK